MPHYDYTCPACEHFFTIRQGFHDEPQAPCPRCGATGRRRLSIPSIVYKGSGFYSTDNGRLSGGASERLSDQGGEPEAGNGSTPSKTDAHAHPH